MTLNIAHRGASGVAPENTLLAFATAIEAGADVIEFDAQITKDEKLVIFHDKTLEKVTGETQRISDFTLEELLKKDAGAWKGSGFQGIRMPTLRETIEFPHDHYGMILEIKPQNIPMEAEFKLERMVLDILDDFANPGGLGDGYISVRTEESYEFLTSNSQKYPVGVMQKKRAPEEFNELVKGLQYPICSNEN